MSEEHDRKASEEAEQHQVPTGDIHPGNDGRRTHYEQVWTRVVTMVKLEPGISEEIAGDPQATRQGLIVAAIAFAASSLVMPLFIPLALAGGLLGIAIGAGLYCLLSRIFSDQVPGYVSWFRTLLFASAPSALGIVPLIGGIVGSVWIVILHVVTIRDLARLTTGAAIVVWLFSVILPMVLFVGALLVVGVTTFLQYLPDFGF